MFDFNKEPYSTCGVEQNIWRALNSYGKDHKRVGGFLSAVLSNNLFTATGLADDINRRCLWEIIGYIYNELPSTCWGSTEIVKEWIDE